jgi:peptidylprolyl isomerase
VRRFVRLLAAVVAAAALCVRAAGAADGDIVLDLALERPAVKLGEDAVLVLTVTNHTTSAATLAPLRLARDSVSVRVAAPGLVPATVTRLYGAFLEGSDGLEFRPAAGPSKRLDPGESMQGRISLPAVLAGTLTLTAVVGEGTPLRLESRPAALEVQGKSGSVQHVAARVETSKGAFTVDLDAAAAYSSVANFWTLAKDGTFDGLPFHRVVAGALAQTGDPRGNGTGGPGWYVPGEPPVATATRGDVGLARGAHADSGGSQWFVVSDAKGTLAGGYVRLGTVTDGLDVLDQLTANEADSKTGRPKSPDRVVSVKTLVR